MWTSSAEQEALHEASFDPPDFDSLVITPEEAYELAKDAVDCDPYAIVAFINDKCPDKPGHVPPSTLAKRLDDGEELTAPELLALAMNDKARALRALHLLRELYRADPDTQDYTSEVADQIEAEQ